MCMCMSHWDVWSVVDKGGQADPVSLSCALPAAFGAAVWRHRGPLMLISKYVRVFEDYHALNFLIVWVSSGSPQNAKPAMRGLVIRVFFVVSRCLLRYLNGRRVEKGNPEMLCPNDEVRFCYQVR